jgi:hypothetical protein
VSAMDPEHLTAVREHLQTLVESSVLNRAPNQIKALAAMVDAACDGREQSGADLAQAVYGRADESYIRAVRQLARELRLKLPLAYEPGKSYPIRFELHPHHYAVRIVKNGNGASNEVPTPSIVIPSQTTRAPGIGFRVGIAVLVATVGLGAIGAFMLTGRATHGLGVPSRVEFVEDQISFQDASGEPLPGWRERLEEVSGFPFRVTPEQVAGLHWVNAVLLEAPSGDEARVAVVTCDKRIAAGRCALHLLASGSGRELDRLELPRLPKGVAVGDRLHEVEGETFVPDWSVSSIDRADLDGDGVHDEIVLGLFLGRLFPSQILALDYDGSWRTLGDYWSMGAARGLPLPDLDGDGRDEIVVFGENNSYQRGFVTLLPSAAGFPVGARSPDGYRLARLAEVEHYPYAGVTLQFPFTDLARDDSDRTLRNPVQSVEWDHRDATLHVIVGDATTDPKTRDRWQVAFQLEAGPTPSSAAMVQYDDALSRLRSLIAERRLEDRWNIGSTQRLSDYGRDLASRILVFDARAPNPSWRPIRNGELGSVFPKTGAAAAVTTSAQ